MAARLGPILGGLKTYIPRPRRAEGTGGTNSARYCYSVWLRHLSALQAHGYDQFPKRIVELGPGDSVGTGIAALITGVDRYIGLDAADYTDRTRDLDHFDALVTLFRERAPIPAADEFPKLYPRLSRYGFPHEILPDEWLDHAMQPGRLAALREDLEQLTNGTASGSTRFFAPWTEDMVEPGSADLVLSQAVLEYVDDLEAHYRTHFRWLRPGGAISHQVDFKAHYNMFKSWNSHWAYSQRAWRLVRGNRACFLNRQPLSVHLHYMRAAGFHVLGVLPERSHDGLRREQLSEDYRSLPIEDLITSSAHFIAVKPS